MTCATDVSRVESTSSIVLRSRTRGGRSSAAIPDIEMRPETETGQEPEIDNPAKIQVFPCLLFVSKVRAPLKESSIFRSSLAPLDGISLTPLVSM